MLVGNEGLTVELTTYGSDGFNLIVTKLTQKNGREKKHHKDCVEEVLVSEIDIKKGFLKEVRFGFKRVERVILTEQVERVWKASNAGRIVCWRNCHLR